MPIGKTIAFLGAGNMAEALVKGLLRAGVAAPQEIVCTSRRKLRGDELTTRYGVRFTTSNVEAARVADLVVLSVKPQVMNHLLDEIAPVLDSSKLVVSIAAGVPIEAIERKVGHGVRIVRTMPNTPALVGAGATALAAGSHATDEDLSQAKALFDAVGKSVVVDEPLLDAVTGLSGSGPAYMFLEAAHRDRGAPGTPEGPGDEPRRHRHRGPAHPGGRRPADHAHGRGGGGHEAGEGARPEVPRPRRVTRKSGLAQLELYMAADM